MKRSPFGLALILGVVCVAASMCERLAVAQDSNPDPAAPANSPAGPATGTDPAANATTPNPDGSTPPKQPAATTKKPASGQLSPAEEKAIQLQRLDKNHNGRIEPSERGATAGSPTGAAGRGGSGAGTGVHNRSAGSGLSGGSRGHAQSNRMSSKPSGRPAGATASRKRSKPPAGKKRSPSDASSEPDEDTPKATKLDRTPAEAIAEIERLGGKVKLDHNNPDRPVVSVDFSGTELDDKGLQNVAVLTTLKSLNLKHTKISGAGLDSLSDLTNLKMLYLDGTHLSNADLKHLETLDSLDELYLYGTQVNGTGANALRKVLPKLKVFH